MAGGAITGTQRAKRYCAAFRDDQQHSKILHIHANTLRPYAHAERIRASGQVETQIAQIVVS